MPPRFPMRPLLKGGTLDGRHPTCRSGLVCSFYFSPPLGVPRSLSPLYLAPVMAAFTSDPAEWQRLDWQLLQNSPVALYFSRAILADDVAWFHQHGYRVLSIQVVDFLSKDALFVALGELFAFPGYFGRSLDAFNDCLSDVEVPAVGGLALVLYDFDRFAKQFPDVAHAILDIVADNARRFLLTGKRFITLVHSSDPAINLDPVGATPVLWNPKESLNSKRGL